MTAADTFVIGARQTVDRACHPQLGEGRAVYGHGPAAFLADSGEVELLRDITHDGAGTKHSSRGRYEHLRAHPMSCGAPFELDTLDRAKGDSHMRIVSPMVGPAWMVSVRGRKRQWIERVEPDSGAPHIVLDVRSAYVGLPPYSPRAKKQRGEDEHWMTLETDKGSFSYQREEYASKAPPPEPSEDPEAKPKTKRSRKKASKKKETPKPSAQARTLPLIDEADDVDETAEFCLAGFGMERACGTGKGSGSGVYTAEPEKVTCKKCLARMHEKPQLVNWYKAQQRRTA